MVAVKINCEYRDTNQPGKGLIMAIKKASTILMEEATWVELKALADRERRSVSAQIEVMIIEALKQAKNEAAL